MPNRHVYYAPEWPWHTLKVKDWAETSLAPIVKLLVAGLVQGEDRTLGVTYHLFCD
jgi:hypothetical protein